MCRTPEKDSVIKNKHLNLKKMKRKMLNEYMRVGARAGMHFYCEPRHFSQKFESVTS